MLNEFRTWLRPVAEHEGGGVSGDIRFVEPRSSLCYVLDEEAGSSHMLASILQGSGMETGLFANSPAFIQGLTQKTPDLVFLDVTAEPNDAIDAVFALGERSYRGGVQLMGARAVSVMDTVKRMGERHSLQMLPLLRKPLYTEAVRQVLQNQKLQDSSPVAPAKVDLSEA